jgi:hypothetical protein
VNPASTAHVGTENYGYVKGTNDHKNDTDTLPSSQMINTQNTITTSSHYHHQLPSQITISYASAAPASSSALRGHGG